MQTSTHSAPISKGALWTGRVISALIVLLMIMSGVTKLMMIKDVTDGFAQMGIPNLIVPIGILDLVLAVLYLIPRTAVLGAILLTGYMGGAIAAVLTVHQPWIAQFIFGVLVWGGLYLRDRRIRALIPLTR